MNTKITKNITYMCMRASQPYYGKIPHTMLRSQIKKVKYNTGTEHLLPPRAKTKQAA